MREIKFRAWDGEKIIPQAALYWRGEDFVSGLWTNAETHIEPEDQIEVQLMQYTGLKDSNGIEIYEGDIVESFVHPDIPLHHIIEWSDKYSGWFARNTTAKNEHDGSIQLFVHERNCKFTVIGNIHENPELLEDD